MRKFFLGLASASLLFGCTIGAASDEADSTAKKTATLAFGGDWSETTTGPIFAGTKPKITYDPARLAECMGEENGIPQYAVTAHYRMNGGPEKTLTVAGLNAAAKPAFDKVAAGDLEVWFEATNRWGCHAWDSDFGANYHFSVVESAKKPKWVGNAASVVARDTCSDTGGPCDADRVPAEQGFTFDTWARQRAAIASVYFEIYQPGETDLDNADLWKDLDVEVHLRAAGQTKFTTRYVDFFRRTGNNARYALDIRAIDPFGANAAVDAASCPHAALSLTPDGAYVSTTFEYYFTVNGKELRPAPGKTFSATFEDYAGLYAACTGG